MLGVFVKRLEAHLERVSAVQSALSLASFEALYQISIKGKDVNGCVFGVFLGGDGEAIEGALVVLVEVETKELLADLEGDRIDEGQGDENKG